MEHFKKGSGPEVEKMVLSTDSESSYPLHRHLPHHGIDLKFCALTRYF